MNNAFLSNSDKFRRLLFFMQLEFRELSSYREPRIDRSKGNVFIRSEFLDRTSSFEIWKFENWMKRDGKALMRKFGSRGRKGRGIWNRWTEVRLRGGRRRRKGGREREKTEEEASMGNPPT